MNPQPQIQPGIVVVDDHRAIREAVTQLLEEHGLTVLGQASRCNEALALVALKHPDLVLIDLSIGDDSGLTLISDLCRLDIPAVVYSSHEDPEYVHRALDAGARAYVSKRDTGQALARTITDVLNGWMLVSPHAAEGLSDD